MTVSDRDLMRYHDGELGPEESKLVRARIERDVDAQERLAGLAELGDALRLWATERGRGFDVTDQVMAATRGVRSPRRALGPLAAVTALAAAMALLAGARWSSEPSTTPARSAVELGSQQPPPRPASPLALPEARTAVESVDFGERSGSIFMVGSSAAPTTVIWLSDTPGDRRRIEPL